MPELPEVEAYRRLAADAALGRPIAAVQADDAWYLKRGLVAEAVTDALTGAQFVGARRIGKLLLLDIDSGGVLGLRFGMSGTLMVDTVPGITGMLYSSTRALPEWDRFGLTFDDGGHLRMNDPRRLGGVELDPDEGRLGVDALSVNVDMLAVALGSSRAPLKARLMDQAQVAGIGNLMADEALWRAGLDPTRPAASLERAELRKLSTALKSTIRDLIERGGSHTGDLVAARVVGGACPRDGAPLVRRQVGGRTTFSCPVHQR